MAKKLSVVLTLDDKQFQSRLRKATKSMGKFGKQMQKTGQSLSRNLTLPILAFGAASVKAFDDQQKALAQVEAGIISTGNAAGFTSNELQKMASDLQAKTLFGDEVILKDATAQLLTFTNIAGKQFERTQLAALNLATRLDGDLKSASIQLGKALNDPIANLSALSRSGIQFSQDQKQVIKSLAETGRLAEAQTIILNELEKQYGGAAEAAAKAGLGPFQQLKNELGDVSEEFGKLILENIEPLKTSLHGLVEGLRSLSTENKKIALKFAGIAAVVGPLLIILGKVITAVKTIISVFMKLTPQGRIVSLVLTGITLAAKPLKKLFSGINKEFKNMVSTAGNVMKGNPLFDVNNYSKVEKKVKDVAKEVKKFREVSSIQPIAAGPVQATEGQTSAAPQLGGMGLDSEWFASMEQGLVAFDNLDEKVKNTADAFSSAFMSMSADADESFAGITKAAANAARQIIKIEIAKAVAAYAAQVFATVPFPVNLALAAASGSIVGSIFNQIIPAFADGGIISGPTIGLMGEYAGARTNPEVIAPLDKLQSMISTGGGQTEVFGRISGADILLSSDRARGNRNRTRGY